MTPAQLATYIRLKTKTNSTTFPDADMVALANVEIDELAMQVAEVNEDYFGIPSTAKLVADQREYPLPDDLLNQIKAVEAKLDGTEWVRLSEFDLNFYHRTTNETEIVNNFGNSEGTAFYDIFRRSLWLYTGTITAVTSGLKLWSFAYPAHLENVTDTSDFSIDPSNVSHGFPRQFHKVLADRIVVAYKESQDNPIPLTKQELELDFRIEKALDAIRGANLDREVVGILPEDSDKGKVWDHGYNL